MSNITVINKYQENTMREVIPFFFMDKTEDEDRNLYYCFFDENADCYRVLNIENGYTIEETFKELEDFTNVFDLENVDFVDVDIILKR